MYNLEFLPIANKNIMNALKYIARTLDNKYAANRLIISILKAIDMLGGIPLFQPCI